MKANWRVDVWGGEPSIADIVDIDTKRPVAQMVSTEVARFIVAMCASSKSMNEDDLKFLREVETRTTAIGDPSPMDGRWIFQAGKIVSISGPLEQPNCTHGTVAIICGGIPEVGEFIASSLIDVFCLIRLVREQDKRARHAERERDAFDARIRELEAEVARLSGKDKP